MQACSKMNKLKMVDIYQITPIIEELLSGGRDVRLTVVGNSMFPMLHSGTDSVVLTKPLQPLSKYDLPLYRRKTGEYVMHRIVKVNDGFFTMNGDNQYMLECPVYPDMIIGVVKEFYRKGKKISCTSFLYRLYCVFWVMFRPLRGVIYKTYASTVGKIKSFLVKR